MQDTIFTNISRTAFTLAEVLITLGIIGVVAAMTMPSLIANYQKKVWVNQLKKSVSVLEQGFQKMLADDDVDNLESTFLWSNMRKSRNGECGMGEYESEPYCNAFYNSLKNYFNLQIQVPGSKYLVQALNDNKYVDPVEFFYFTNSDPALMFNDGQLVSIYTIISANNYSGDVVVDVNGIKRPNKIGRDIFSFILTPQGKLIPYGSKKAVDINYNSTSWKEYSEYCGTPGKADAEEKANGTGCAARIIENGWEMDY